MIYNAADGSCVDTLIIQVSDPNSTSKTQNTIIDLGYSDIDCPGSVTAECGENNVAIFIATGTPTPIWSFCSTTSCYGSVYSSDTIGDVSGCLADSIIIDTLSIFSSNDFCSDTSQNAFIVLDSQGDTVTDNTFLEYLSQLQDSSNLDCIFSGLECSFVNTPACYDSIVIDTTILPIPVRIGGQWTMPLIDTLQLYDTTYFTRFGNDYELILDPGVDFYGPGNLKVELNEIIITSTNDTIRQTPVDFYFTLQWEEEWILDTLLLIRELPFDTDDDCFACGGSSFQSLFNIPGIPEFPCGPIGIYFPSICDCEFQYPNFNFQLVNCEPRTWQFDITSFGYISQVDDATADINFDVALITNPTSQYLNVITYDYNGCSYYSNVDIEDYIEQINIQSTGVLSCEVESVYVSVDGNFIFSNEAADLSSTLWIGQSTGSGITVYNEGNYTATFTDAQGCEYTASIYVDYDDTVNCEDNPLANTECDELEEMEIICEIMTFNSFDYVMPTENSGYNQPYPLCNEGGTPDNMSWFSFVAYSGDYSINIIPNACVPSSSGLQGIQAGLYTDCTFSNSSFCSGECTEGTISITSNILTEGQVYYMFLDGCDGSVCNYQMEIQGNPEEPNLTPIGMTLNPYGENIQNANTAGIQTFCLGTNIFSQLSGVEIEGEYHWTVNTLEGDSYSGAPSSVTTRNGIYINFDTEGTYEVCLNEVNNGCDLYTWTGNMCFTLEIVNTDDEDFGVQYICEGEIGEFDQIVFNNSDPNEDGILGLQSNISNFQIGTNTLLGTDADGCNYTQVFEIAEFGSSDLGTIKIVDCYSELPLTINGFVLDAETYGEGNEFTFEIPTLEQNINGCDSAVQYSVELVRLAEDISIESTCSIDGITLNFEEYYAQVSNDGDVTFIVFDPNNDMIGSISSQGNYTIPHGSMDGNYTLHVSKTKENITCEVSEEIMILFSELEPKEPEITGGPMAVCPTEGVVRYTATNEDPNVNFIWSVDASDFNISGNQNQNIDINWNNSGGILSVIAVNDCGIQEGTDVAITIHNTPELLLTNEEETCRMSEAIITLAVDQSLIDSYSWDFDGGTVSAGNGSGPYSIIWDSNGSKNITLSTIDIYGCDQFTESVIMVNEIPLAEFTVSTDSICLSESVAINVINNVQPLTEHWDFDEGTNIGINDPVLVFDSPGWKNILLTTDNGICTSEQFSMSIYVAMDMDDIEVSCLEQGLHSLQFGWNDIEGADRYLVTINNLPPQEVEDNMFFAEGLEENTAYTIEVSVITDHKCPPSKVLFSCQTEECIGLEFTFDIPEVICIEDDMDMIDMIALSSGIEEGFSWTGENINGSTFDPNGLVAGVYTFEITHQEDECISSDLVEITLVAPPSFEMAFDPIVCNGQVTTTLELFAMEDSYTIFVDGEVSASVSEISIGAHEIMVLISAMCSYSESILVEEYDLPDLNILGDLEIKEGEEHSYSLDEASLSNLDINSIVWTINGSEFCDDKECTSINPILEIDSDLEVAIFYNDGCVTTSMIRILVEEKEPELFIPNIFSPNNDGLNDHWFVVKNKEEITLMEIKVYDRWNNLVYLQKGDQSNSEMKWDGKFKGYNLQPGVYVYAVTYAANDKVETVYGDVTLIM